MQRNSAAIIGLSIVLGFLLLGLLNRPGPTGSIGSIGSIGSRGGPNAAEGEVGRYQFLRASDVTLAVLDTKTGRVWMKFVSSNEGPAKWSEDSPDLGPPVLQQSGAQQTGTQQVPAPPKK